MRRLWPLLVLIACGEPAEKPAAPPQPDVHLALPDFSFQEAQGGRAIGKQDLLGKVWVAATVFTNCPTHCPAMTQEMYGLQKEFADEPDFRLFTLSVDPARDTVEVLRKYARANYADPERWYFARHPDRAVVRAFVVDGLRIAWDDAEPLNHSYRLVLVDRHGRVRGWYKRTEAEQMRQLRAMIRTLLAEKPNS